MRNLVLFVYKYHFTFLFILLEVTAVLLLSTNNSFQRTRLHNLSLSISGEVFEFQKEVTGYVNLSRENEVLRAQNALLENELFERAVMGVSKEKIGDFEVQPATVINSTYTAGNNYVVVNAGSEKGVESKMGVRSTEGIVGVVTHVSGKYAAIMPIIHENSRVSCQLAKNNYFGLLEWEGKNHRHALLQNIPNHVDIDSGDAIITRGSRGIFPKGIPVGTAISTEKNPSTGFQSIQVLLATNFEHLNTAYIIQNKLAPELDSLSAIITNDE